MPLLDLLAGIPVNANLRLQLEAFEKKFVALESENLLLRQEKTHLQAENTDLRNQIASLKKPKGPYQVPTKRVGG